MTKGPLSCGSPATKPSDLLTIQKEQQTWKDSDRPLHTERKGNEPQNCSLSVLLSTLQPVAHIPSFSFISSHHIPLLHCHSPSTVRERLSLAVTAGFPGSGDPATKPSCIPWHNMSRATWQLKCRPRKFPVLLKKGTPSRLTN